MLAIGATLAAPACDAVVRGRASSCDRDENANILARVPDPLGYEMQAPAGDLIRRGSLRALDGNLAIGTEGEYDQAAWVFAFRLDAAASAEDIGAALQGVRALEGFEGAQLDVCGRDLLRRKERENSI